MLCSNLSMSPAGQDSKVCGCGPSWDRQTDKRTDAKQMHRRCSAYYVAGPIIHQKPQIHFCRQVTVTCMKIGDSYLYEVLQLSVDAASYGVHEDRLHTQHQNLQTLDHCQHFNQTKLLITAVVVPRRLCTPSQ